MKNQILFILFISQVLTPLVAQNKRISSSKADEEIKFTPLIHLNATSVKNQSATSTCWSFATTSFMESELLRMGKGEYDLSEMFIVRYNYINRLKDNFMRNGRGNTGPGSLAHDWLRIFREHGIVPDEIYPGLKNGSATHDHGELQDFINAAAAVPLQRKNESEEYNEILKAILDTYLGNLTDSFTYRNVTYTPESFAQNLGINPDDYVEITSFNHIPWYSQGILEIPDNWSKDKFYNVPLEDLIEIMDHSLENGYTVNWDGDISEAGFSFSEGLAVLSLSSSQGTFPVKGSTASEKGGSSSDKKNPLLINKSRTEDLVSQETRQVGFENFTTTDDHMMHITGSLKDQYGVKYYITKNSWGSDKNRLGGYIYMSENYVRSKTMFVMVCKDAVPQAIRTKLGF